MRNRLLVVFKSHRLSAAIQKQLNKTNHTVLCCHRDIRDATASYQAKIGKMLSTEEALGFAATAIEQFSDWERLVYPNKVISRYSEMIANLPGEIRTACSALGIEISDRMTSKIHQTLTPQTLQTRISSLSIRQLSFNHESTWDPVTLLHSNHFNGGRNNKGRELSDEAFQEITSSYRVWLNEHGYEA